VRVEPGAELTVLENGPAAARFNKCMEIDVADGAAFHHVRAQGRDHERRAVTHMFARLGTEATYKSFTLTANGVLTRNEHVLEMTGDDAMAHVAGAAMGDGASAPFHHDDTVFVTHDAERCESRQVFKKVLRNGAAGVFQGKILVKPGAQKTDGYQISQALLLDDDSLVPGQAGAGDLRRRRAVLARLDHGRAGRDGALLPAFARGAGVPGDGPSGAGLPGRGDRRDRG
jgi:Fe-S cluster assembly protein SufD